jgi:predicted nucleic acid-binding protein
MEVKLLLDTNAIIALLKENEKIKKATDTADAIFISIISELEFKSFKNISKSDLRLFDSFTSMIDVVDLEATNNILKKKIIEIRNTYRLKLPDAIIAATAIVNNATLITADTDFRKVKDLEILSIHN